MLPSELTKDHVLNMQWISLFKHQPEHGSPRTRAQFSENKSAPKLENRKKSPCPPRAPNLLHVLPSRMVGWNELCNPGMSKCLLRFPAWPNYLLHWKHMKFFSLMWVAMWLLKFPDWSNESSHSDQNASFPHSLRANASSFHYGFGVDWEDTPPWHLSNS